MAKSITKSAGRPRNVDKSVRISPRFPEGVAETLRKASALRGVTVSSFVVESAQLAAERVIRDETQWALNEKETESIVRLLHRPPKVNVAALAAEELAADVEIRS